MQNELQRQTGNLRESIDKFIQENVIPVAGSISSGTPANVYDNGTCLIVSIAIPGVSSENLDVTASGETVRIRGSYGTEAPLDVKVLRQELPRGKFDKTVPLPVAVDTETASAHYHDGVLTLSLPKSVKSALRPIMVQTVDSSAKTLSSAPGSAITKPMTAKTAATRQPQAGPMIGKNEDEVDMASDASFPASDPPAVNSGAD